jgi:hypothetical protein
MDGRHVPYFHVAGCSLLLNILDPVEKPVKKTNKLTDMN